MPGPEWIERYLTNTIFLISMEFPASNLQK